MSGQCQQSTEKSIGNMSKSCTICIQLEEESIISPNSQKVGVAYTYVTVLILWWYDTSSSNPLFYLSLKSFRSIWTP